MSKQEKMMKAFEIGWMIVGIIALSLGVYKTITSDGKNNDHYLLFLVALLALFMVFIKKTGRRMLRKNNKRFSANRDQNTD